MATKLEKLEGNKAKLEIAISGETFEDGLQKAYLKNKAKFSLPGFRKGKAPRKMIEQFYGTQVFFEDALDEVIPPATQAAIEEHKLEIVSRPEYDITSIDPKEGIIFTAEMFLKPEVELGQYEGIEITQPSAKVSAKEVSAELERLQNQNARWVDVERAVKNGDTVVIDYSGSVEDVKFDGGTAEQQTLEIGSGRFIPGFEEQIVGMKIGEEKDINIKFPDEYAPELAGKDAVFAIKLHGVRERQLPELDDDFAQDVSEFETLADYKKDIKEKLTAKAEMRAKADKEQQLLSACAQNAKVEIPDVMVESQIDYQLQQMQYQLMYQGIKMEDYLQYLGKSMQEFREEGREEAAKQVKMRLVVEALIEKLGLTPSDEDMEKKLAEMAAEAGKTPEEYRNLMGAEASDYLKDRVVMEMLYDYLHAKAVVKEAKEEAEKKPAAKKAAAKPAADKEKKPAAKKAAADKAEDAPAKPKKAPAKKAKAPEEGAEK